MSVRDNMVQARDAWSGFWRARNHRERNFLLAAFAVIVIGATYALMIDPALSQRPALEKSLPHLRQQAAQMRQMTQQLPKRAAADKDQSTATSPADFSKEGLDASLKNLGLNATEINVSDRTVRLQFASASLARLLAWLEQMQAQRLSVTEADMQTLANTDSVKATVMLTRTIEEQQ